MAELIICEKPAQAEKIASALGKPKKHLIDKVPYYEVEYKGKKILIGCAVGHLFNLAEKEKNGWRYPVWNIEWQPAYEINKKSDFSKKYFKVLEKLAKQADDFVIGCDYDVEGSLIGYNCLRFIAHQRDGKRMKFSTLTKDELINSYENAMPHLDFPVIEAGETRHILDWIAGINLSRALTLAVKSAGLFKLLSIGRVQGPALKIIVDREEEIRDFKPVPYWELFLDGKAKGKDIHAEHVEGKIFDKKKADALYKKTKNKPAVVADIQEKSSSIAPLPPFDLTTLQTESYRYFGISPKETLAIAQDLYTAGLISYPRTSSQKLPAALGHKSLLEKISKIKEYSLVTKELLKQLRQPVEGKKSDPAHPCFTEDSELALNPHGNITFKKLTEKATWAYDKAFGSFFYCPKESVKILAFDSKEIVPSYITKIWKTPYQNKKMLKINCSNGTIVQTTPNHRFYTITKNGFEYIESQDLVEGMIIGALPSRVDSIQNRIIIDEGDFIKTYNEEQQLNINNYLSNKKLFKLKPSEVQTLHKLRILNLLPLKYNTKEAEILAKLVGFVCGDGHLNYYKVSDRKSKYPISVFVAEFADLERIKFDLASIGIKIGSKIKRIKNTNKVYFLQIRNSIVNRLLVALGAPMGDKVTKDFAIPKWIINGNKAIKKAFLSTYFGNESSKPRSHYRNKRDLKSLSIQMDKLLALDKSAINFYLQIKNILEEDFHIKVSEIKQKLRTKVRKKDNKPTCSTILTIKNNRKNLLKFFLNIGFSYCSYKEKLAKKAIAYLIFRNNLIQERLKKRELAIELKKEGKNNYKISRLLNVPRGTINGWLNYGKSHKEYHVSSELPKFDEFNLLVNNEGWTFIENITEIDGPEYVYDIEVNRYHTFFVNGLLVHNCIYTTGEHKKLEGKAQKVYDLIVRRFLACFAEPLERKVVTVIVDVNNESFITKGITILKQGWHSIYHFAKLEEQELPSLQKEDAIEDPRIALHEDQTKPPKRYTEASLIKELERLVIGTKSTRAAIIDTLYQRNYIKEKAIEATTLGIATVNTLKKYCPEILDEQLTRHFEEEKDLIMEEKKKKDEVLEETKQVLFQTLEHFKKHEKKIGEGLLEATKETRHEMSKVGPCPVCKSGELMIRSGKFGQFVACNKYPDCKTTFSVPSSALIKTTDQLCKECNFMQIIAIRKGRRPWLYCLNKECPAKVRWREMQARKAAESEVKEEKPTKKSRKKKSKA